MSYYGIMVEVTDEERATLGRRLSVQLNGKTINVSAVARQLNIDQSGLSKFLLGRVHPRVSYAQKVAKALGLTTDELMDLISLRTR